jgi:ferredoxin-NADP reductase
VDFTVKVLSTEGVTHDVTCIRVEKPAGYQFTPGQATDVSINKTGWESQKRPFTFTALVDNPYLEFTIKCYIERDSVTKRMKDIVKGDELIIGDAWGAIEYKGEGYFIAGGAGITPFIAILRNLYREKKLGNNKLFFSNKTSDDIVYKQELSGMLGNNITNIITQGREAGNMPAYIDKSFLETQINDFSKKFYICGPDKMIASINQILVDKGVKPETVIFEK